MEAEMAATNFVTEHLLSGNVTLNLVGLCVTVASMAVGITLWAVYTFQTKDDARDQDERQKRSVDETRVNFKAAFDDLHNHMTTMKNDTKQELRQLQQDFSAIRQLVSQVGSDVSFLRGKAETNSRGMK